METENAMTATESWDRVHVARDYRGRNEGLRLRTRDPRQEREQGPHEAT